jgi:hypothetical protein
MNKPYTFFENLVSEIPEIPSDSIISRTIYNDDRVKVVLFGFAPGQELSEHTAATPALLYFVQGEGSLALGDDTRPVLPRPGRTWRRNCLTVSTPTHPGDAAGVDLVISLIRLRFPLLGLSIAILLLVIWKG